MISVFSKTTTTLKRVRITIGGVVQGVGFRPFVFTSANEFGLAGFVMNTSAGVVIEVEGGEENLFKFKRTIRHNAPPLARISSFHSEEIPLTHSTGFCIANSEDLSKPSTFVSPDISICEDCLSELFDSRDRRFHYPFINCTNCGPRFTITKTIPYDRRNTTMDRFEMCDQCRREYDDPLDRRFHAQPNACPQCGPRVWFVNGSKGEIRNGAAIAATRDALMRGEIVAVKGIGGFHLACDAHQSAAVQTLRERKGRVDKPFAVMCADIGTVETLAEVGDGEKLRLTSKERPIVLLRKKVNVLSEFVAPGNLHLGAMLPYSPLHHLLFGNGLTTLVMTSGNYSSEPIVTENADAMEKLGNLADAFLLHDRDIFVPCDDSVVRILDFKFEIADLKSQISNESQITHRKSQIANRNSQIELPIRRSRGYAPLPVELPFEVPAILALGGDIKATFCVAKELFAFMSQHMGDMENLETLDAMANAIEQMKNLFRIEPDIIVGDLHPNYLSTNWAAKNVAKIGAANARFVRVQHHHAHIASVMAENGLENEKVIGFAFDGTGYGTDGAIWGGEALIADYAGFERAAHLKYIQLPGGDVSIEKPYRVALSHLWQAGVAWDEALPCVSACSTTERKILRQQLEKKFNTVPTSSFGRLYDAVASIAGVRQTVTYEAQAAIEFEAALNDNVTGSYDFELTGDEPTEIGCEKLIRQVVLDMLEGVEIGVISSKFNSAVAELILQLSTSMRERERINKVALSGGCFQNVALLRTAVRLLSESGFEIITHGVVPPNDGGLALGQAAIAGYGSLKH